MSSIGPFWLLYALGWFLFVICPIATAVVSVVAWRRRAQVVTVVAAVLLAVTLLVAAIVPDRAPAVVTALTTLAALVVAVAGGSPVVRLLLDRTAFGEREGCTAASWWTSARCSAAAR
ncbi:hypothetical protein [Amnibacterium kyonggiense]